MRRFLPVYFACALGALAQPAKPEILIAAASNLTEVFKAIGPDFESATGIHPVFTFASTAQLVQQIENGAPCDVVAAADTEHVEALDRKRLIAPGTRAVYALGVLALWIPAQPGVRVDRVEDLASPSVRVVAMAKPELAPYGQAALDTLRAAGVWERVQPKVVYAANIAMAAQYGSSGNADAVFTAYSLVMSAPGKVIQVDERLHRPIAQSLGVVAASRNQAAARKFTAYLISGAGREALARHGYRLP